MQIKIEKDKAKVISDENCNSGAINNYEIEVDFSDEWDNLTKKAIFVDSANNAVEVAYMDDKFIVPKLTQGKYYIGFVGYTIENEVKTKQISTNLIAKLYVHGAGDEDINIQEEDVPDASTWEQYVATMNAIMQDTIEVRDDIYNKYDDYNSNAAAKTTEFNNNFDTKKAIIDGVCTNVQEIEDNVEQMQEDINTAISDGLEDYNTNATAKTDEFNTNFDEKKNEIDVTAEEVETARQEVATNTATVESDKTQVAEDKASVNSTYADFLAQLGNEIATLGQDGKIPMSQIPATATMEIYEVSSESELIGLTAQHGDLAELVEEIDGERIVTKTWQLLGTDSTVRANWVTWGTSYAVSAGNASNATNAEDSTKINGKRIISMTKEAYDNAYSSGTLLEDTFYFVEE